MEKKQYKLRILPLFEHDMNEITDYISFRLHNPDAAARFIDAVAEALNKRLPMAETFEPYRGIREREYPYYWIKVGSFIIFYVVIGDVMEVRRIIYQKRNMNKRL